MTHTIACPKCGKIVPWTKGKKREHERFGTKIISYDMLLICPKHGEFEPRAHERLREMRMINK